LGIIQKHHHPLNVSIDCFTFHEEEVAHDVPKLGKVVINNFYRLNFIPLFTCIEEDKHITLHHPFTFLVLGFIKKR
jgi:hypothetical protein